MDTVSGRVDRSVMSVATLHDEPDERSWWWRRTPLERLAAIETMRRVVYGRAAPLLTDDFKEFLRLLNAHSVDCLLTPNLPVRARMRVWNSASIGAP